MSDIAVSDLYKSFGAKDVLKGITFEVNKGYVYSVIGNNGCGKTTLFKILTGAEHEDKGNIFIKSGLNIGYLEQIPETKEKQTVEEVLNEAFKNIFQIEEQIRAVEMAMQENSSGEILKKFSNLQLKHELMGGNTVTERLKRITQGLSIDDGMCQSLFHTCSGGEKTRVLLAKLLLSDTDVLLLDEPTNHLDIDSIEWLERFINGYGGAVMIISHDRYFLDKVSDYTIDVNGGRAETYRGNYSFYVSERDKNILRQEALYERQQKEIKRLTARVRQLHDWANNEKTHRRAFAMEKRIEHMEKIERVTQDRKIVIRASSKKFMGKELLKVSRVDFSYKAVQGERDKEIFRNAELNIYRAENVGILGPNGCGKTTFVKLLLGQLSPQNGSIQLAPSVKYAYLPQNVIFERPDRSLLEYIQTELGLKTGEGRNLLAKYNFTGEDVFKEISILSGGEKSRLRLCCLLQQELNLLILDEPTNHLDIASREILENMLEEFEGVILFISHDRYFIRRFADRIVEIENKGFNSYGGGYDLYLEEKESKRKEVVRSPTAETDESNAANDSEAERKDAEQKKAAQRAKDPWRIKKAAEIEESIAALEAELSNINTEMYKTGTSYERIVELTEQKAEITLQIDSLMILWEKYQ